MKPLALLLLLIVSLHCQAEPGKEERFRQAVHGFIAAFNAKDTAAINRMIHPDVGVYIMGRMAVYTTWLHLPSLCLDPSCGDNNNLLYVYHQALLQQKLNDDLPLQYGHYPELVCDQDPPPQPILITDPEHQGTVLVETVQFFLDPMYQEGFDQQELKETLERMLPYEAGSRKILLISKHGDIFHFYLSYIDGDWYLINLDYATMDCSA